MSGGMQGICHKWRLCLNNYAKIKTPLLFVKVVFFMEFVFCVCFVYLQFFAKRKPIAKYRILLWSTKIPPWQLGGLCGGQKHGGGGQFPHGRKSWQQPQR